MDKGAEIYLFKSNYTLSIYNDTHVINDIISRLAEMKTHRELELEQCLNSLIATVVDHFRTSRPIRGYPNVII